MKALAQDSGGLAFLPKGPEELGAVYDAIATELAHQYVLAYVPGNRASHREFRAVNVRIASQAAVQVRTRRGYDPSQ